ncbi:hypothetical protein KSP35_18385 [Aquihabitans sp. G128]|uniref:DUF5989 family protein n=1 Tax=Aquihabitans sp. G128 TaxID=2849779 RepID=UPI001C238A62|nr:DUF5989 family protein [Aquihabitans sp. G128]QXC60283.1 hypothetical protein KSP35_18385 [Aquihabitans sp. G128]
MSPAHHGGTSSPARRPGQGLPLATRTGLRFKHGLRLAREVSRFGAEQRLWWFVPLVTIVLLFALAVTATTSALPVAVYTLF